MVVQNWDKMVKGSMQFNHLPNNQIMDWTKLKAFGKNNQILKKIVISDFESVKNIVGKGENAGYQHFLLFQQ